MNMDFPGMLFGIVCPDIINILPQIQQFLVWLHKHL